MTMVYPNPCFNEACHEETALYIFYFFALNLF